MSVLNKLIDKVSEYIKLKGEKVKLDIIARISRLLAHFVAVMSIVIVGFFMLIFLSIALSTYLNTILESPHLGYLLVAGIYFILLIIVFLLLRTNKIQIWLETIFVNLNENQEQEDE